MADKSLKDMIFRECGLARNKSQEVIATSILEELIKAVASSGQNSVDDIVSFINLRISNIDSYIQKSLNDILHNDKFMSLEASWRGLYYLVSSAQDVKKLKIRVLDVSKEELMDDHRKTSEFDQSNLFKKIYEEEYGTFGGNPFSCLIADYEFSHYDQDIELLRCLSSVASASHAPLMTCASPNLFDIKSFQELNNIKDLSRLFEGMEYYEWNSLRSDEDSRYLAICLPKALMRIPYKESSPINGFYFDENVDGDSLDGFCWGNPAYLLASRIANAFDLYGWPMAIRGVDDGSGFISDLSAYVFKTTRGDVALKCPTEVAITDRREKELTDAGFTALCYCKNTSYAAFFGAQTIQNPDMYNTDIANANAVLSTRLPYMLSVSRFVHYIKAIMRDKIGEFDTRESIEKSLNSWIASYVLLNDEASQETKAKYPLREAKIEVYDIKGKPGCYKAVIYIRPHFQLEEFTASIRLVAELPHSTRR